MRNFPVTLLSLLIAACSGAESASSDSPEVGTDSSVEDGGGAADTDASGAADTSDEGSFDTTTEADVSDVTSDADGSDATDVDSGSDTADQDTSATDTGAANWVVTTGVAAPLPACAAAAACAPGAIQAGRETHCGELSVGSDTFALPAPLTPGPVAAPLYDVCTGSGENVSVDASLETVVVNPGGEVVTASLFADNYFELFVNGVMVGRDSLGFTPFNAAAVRFAATYPMTIAVSLVDWEGYLGVGLEDRNGALHIGDGGFIASFSNGLQTGAAWKCEAFYAAPLDTDACLALTPGGGLDSTACPDTDATVDCVGAGDANGCSAAHRLLPDGWSGPGFDDSGWRGARLYAADLVTRDPAYTTFAATRFADAAFIWSGNLNLDNHVVCRITLNAPP